MREIKFKAIDSITKRWIYSNGYYFDGTNYWFITPNIDSPAIGFADYHIVLKNTICQYTGVKDKNDKEIYEGDIVKYSIYNEYTRELLSTLFEVVFHEGAFVQEHRIKLDPDYYKVTKTIWYEWDFTEVVDNIYENPELLE